MARGSCRRQITPGIASDRDASEGFVTTEALGTFPAIPGLRPLRFPASYLIMKTTDEATSDPVQHSRNLQKQLGELIDHARQDIDRVSEPRFQALLETSAEVLSGLRTAFEHYDQGSEKAWRR
jgi:hypothetical protein